MEGFEKLLPVPTATLRFTYFGFLPEGVHEATLSQLHELVVTNPQRQRLWKNLEKFLYDVRQREAFSCAFFDGGFVSSKPNPDDIDLILQTHASYGPEAFQAMAPYFAIGLGEIYRLYGIHLHFWCEGFPGGLHDFRLFFQYLRPQDAAPLGLAEGAKKGIVKVKL